MKNFDIFTVISACSWLWMMCIGCTALTARQQLTTSERKASGAPLSPADSMGLKALSASNPLIRYVGRVDLSDPERPAFSFPGVNVHIRFTGTSLHVLLDDNALNQAADTTNYFSVVVDGGEPVRLKTLPSVKEYVLAEELPAGEHEVILFKRSESSHGDNLNVGKVSLNGFKIDADAKLLAPLERKLKMEFIGDSITCGYGNELSVANPIEDHFTTINSNAHMAWGAIAARKLDADYAAVAYSGRGMVRNYDGTVAPTIPEIYLKTLPDDPNAAAWAPTRYTPDIVVVNLGTNDFSVGVSPGAALDELESHFASRYESFLSELMGYYPDARFILTVGPMLSDDFPEGYNALTRVKRVLTGLVDKCHSAGNKNVFMLVLPTQSAPFGEDYHPTVATHQKMADKLVALVDKIKDDR